MDRGSLISRSAEIITEGSAKRTFEARLNCNCIDERRPEIRITCFKKFRQCVRLGFKFGRFCERFLRLSLRFGQFARRFDARLLGSFYFGSGLIQIFGGGGNLGFGGGNGFAVNGLFFKFGDFRG